MEGVNWMVFQLACRCFRGSLRKSKIRRKSCWIVGYGEDRTSLKHYVWVLALSFADVRMLTDSRRAAKQELRGHWISCVLIWNGASGCWDVLLSALWTSRM